MNLQKYNTFMLGKLQWFWNYSIGTDAIETSGFSYKLRSSYEV